MAKEGGSSLSMRLVKEWVEVQSKMLHQLIIMSSLMGNQIARNVHQQKKRRIRSVN